MLATAKIHILKQFTTNTSTVWSCETLCLLLQRYTFWSNSQRSVRVKKLSANCACYCKDTHFEAIHNTVFGIDPKDEIVLATAKIHILKQFTTYTASLTVGTVLCLLLQRYTFWSNSQRDDVWATLLVIVLATAKIHILKQFTTPVSINGFGNNCACYCKDTHFEAIHNPIYLMSMR